MILLSYGTSRKVFISSSHELVERLKRFASQTDNLTLELNSSVQYRLKEGFYYLKDKIITFKSNSNYPANISCARMAWSFSKSYPTSGIVFLNSTVMIARVSFIYCGRSLQQLPTHIIDTLNMSSPLYYSSTHAGTLIFIHCNVNMDTVRIESSYGFAVVGFNLGTSTFQCLDVCNSYQRHEHYKTSTGSGMILHFSDSQKPENNTNISLFNSLFEKNTDFFTNFECISDFFTSGKASMSRYSLINAVGLTIAYTQTDYQVNVYIDQTNFFHNIGVHTGAVLIIKLQHNNLSSTKLINSEFKGNAFFNTSPCHGVAIQFFWFGKSENYTLVMNNLFTIENTVFNGRLVNPTEHQTTSVVFIGIYCHNVKATFHLKKLHFINHNTTGISGRCMTMILHKHFGNSSTISIVLTSITATNNSIVNYNSPRSEFQFKNIKYVKFDGTGHFENNFGTVIYAQESNLYIYGNMTFSDNTAERGAAIRMEGNCLLHFMSGLNASFINNEAYMYGGAIYAIGSSYTKCAIQVENPSNVRISFKNNSAKMAGNSIFAASIYQCEINGHYHGKAEHSYQKYFNLPRGNQELSTYPSNIIVHIHNQKQSLHNGSLKAFPGEKIILNVSAYDYFGNKVFAYINMEAFNSDRHKPVVLWLKRQSMNNNIEDKYTLINVSIHTQSDLQSAVDAVLIFSVPGTLSETHAIKLLPCPKGFTLHKLTGTCECSHIFSVLQETKCVIEERKIVLSSRYTNAWIGVMERDKRIAISKTCPVTYCTSVPHKRVIKFREDEVLVLVIHRKKIPICSNNRIGILCGQCNKTGNYSIVFGSTECKKCSNLWLITVLIYMLAGPLLIYFLYTLKLTLTAGTLNGIIFYAQAANAGLLQSVSQPYYGENTTISEVYQICSAILSTLNLNLGFPLCFYNGMNQLWKTGLSLVFPVYLLTIVVFIIILSRKSTWLSNRTSHSSVQVLVTVVHLSFSKLLLALIDVFISAKIHTSKGNHHVWYWDGSVGYMSFSHCFLATITVSVSLPLLLPYIIILLFGRHIIRCSTKATFYIKPIYEAVHAPLKEGRHYWFGARQLLITTVYILYGLLSSTPLFVAISSILSMFGIGQALFRPYKSKQLYFLDCWLMLNITVVYITFLTHNSLTSAIVRAIILTLAVLTFMSILLYHILLVMNCCYGRGHHSKKRDTAHGQYLNIERELLESDSYYGSCNTYREPALSYMQ